jgi:hypothetical protein
VDPIEPPNSRGATSPEDDFSTVGFGHGVLASGCCRFFLLRVRRVFAAEGSGLQRRL